MRGVTFQFFGVTAHLLNNSTRTPHAGSDASGEGAWSYAPLFQPALPMRGVTKAGVLVFKALCISTRTPHAGSDSRLRRVAHALLISTRTPHAGSDS